MGYRGEAYFCAVGSKEGVFSDKEYINCQLHVLLKLDELHGYLDNALHCLHGIFSPHVTLHFQHRMTPNDFSGLHILRRDLAPGDSSCTYYCSKVCCRWIDHLLVQVSCPYCPCNLSLAEQLHVVLNGLEKSKLTHLPWIADVQSAWMHLKQ